MKIMEKKKWKGKRKKIKRKVWKKKQELNKH